MPTAAMPETTIHENSEPELAESKIWFARQRLLATPAFDVVGAEDRRELEFRVFVAVRVNRRHDLRAFLFAEHIRHAANCRQSGG